MIFLGISFIWLIVALVEKSVVFAEVNSNNGICNFIASTNIESVYSEWSCNATGQTITNPCDPVWRGLGCNTYTPSGVITLIDLNLLINGTLPDGIGQLSSLTSFSIRWRYYG